MEREHKLALIQRTLALKHKIKVHDSTKAPETHEEIAAHTLARWELEDEIRAIDALLNEVRSHEIVEKKEILEGDMQNLIKKQQAKKKSMSSRVEQREDD